MNVMKRLTVLLGIAILLPIAGSSAVKGEPLAAASLGRSGASGSSSDADPLTAIRRYVAEHFSTDEAEIQVRPAGAVPVGAEVLAVREAMPGVL